MNNVNEINKFDHLTLEILIYLAGIIDRKSSIQARKVISRHKKLLKKTNVIKEYEYIHKYARIQICSTDKNIQKWLSDNIKNCADTSYLNANYNPSTIYRWIITGKNAFLLTQKVLPYVQFKKNELQEIINLWSY